MMISIEIYSTDRRTLWHFFSRDIAALYGLSLGWYFNDFDFFFILHSFQLQILSLKFNNKVKKKKSFSFYYLIFTFCGYQKILREMMTLYTHILLLLSSKFIFVRVFFSDLNFTTIEALTLCLNYNFMFEMLLKVSLLPFADIRWI